jgi:hypothetical protein
MINICITDVIFFKESNKFYINNGLWTLLGILIFFCIEKLFPDDDEDQQVENYKKHDDHQNTKNTDKKFLSKLHFMHSIKVKLKLIIVKKNN